MDGSWHKRSNWRIDGRPENKAKEHKNEPVEDERPDISFDRNRVLLNWGAVPKRKPLQNNARQGRTSSLQSTQFRTETENRYVAHEERKRNLVFSFKYLELLSNNTSEEIIAALLTNKDFSAKFDQDVSGNWIVLIVKVLSKVCSSSFNTNKMYFVQLFCKEKFIDTLKTFIALLATHDERDKARNQYFWENSEDFWSNIVLICNTVIVLTPSVAITTISKLVKVVIMSIGDIEVQHSVGVCVQLRKNLEKMNEQLLLYTSDTEKKRKEMEPPDNFRHLSVFPTSMEVTQKNRSFVRQNKVLGKYRDVEEYLDIQFRLLREDFVNPLRQGICQYLNQENKSRIDTIKVYPKVQFFKTEDVRNSESIFVKFEFDKEKLRKMKEKLENSKRFMFGALLCFTEDNFQTLIFGRITENDAENLKRGITAVTFDKQTESVIEYHTDYIMVEYSIYFEPYYHVLKALQAMDADNFPMERYIIGVEPHINCPKYLTPETKRYTLSDMVDKIDLFDPVSWPTAKKLHLNDIQYEAFRAALTKEFCIIQGPPGTGKTYLGLKIVETLIRNSEAWHDDSPILVICYTNHALDQFLEGVKKTTKSMIRVGGQSKSSELEEFNIKAIRSGFSLFTKEKYDERNMISKGIDIYRKILRSINNFDCIFEFIPLCHVDPAYKNNWFATADSVDAMTWLLGGNIWCDENDGNVAIGKPSKQNLEKTKNKTQNTSAFSNISYLRSNLAIENMYKDLLEKEGKIKILAESECDEQKAQQLEMMEEYLHLQSKIEYVEMRLQQGKSWVTVEKPASVNMSDPHNMPSYDRWKLYFYWLRMYETDIRKRLLHLHEHYIRLTDEYHELREMDDVRLMRRVEVVGMTTTSAARLQRSLQALKCRIVVVEEAAEVLESHIVSSLTSHCDHLILIGDHQQLRPTTADYHLETRMNLGISLFERMIMNGIPHTTLSVQHRMRPEISGLIRPAIYPHLEDHESVLDMPAVRGMEKCVYFFHHTNRETNQGDSSKVNKFEAVFLVRLARHLVQNGYDPEDVTILAAYLGQYYTILREMQNDYLLKKVPVAVLDNYQGEECKIILLSLVRNNDTNSVGFLKTENRVCVALSRAKQGLYIMGNIDLLCQNSEVWPKIRSVLEDLGSLGECMNLRCFIHQDRVTSVKEVYDFNKCPKGGCDKICNIDLKCGHNCRMFCHVLDRDHKLYRCNQPCARVLCEDVTHICLKLCHEECGPCNYKVLRQLPCNHSHELECHIDVSKYKCPTLLSTELFCGHDVLKPCHINLKLFKCPLRCNAELKCGHFCGQFCHVNNDADHLTYKCLERCKRYRRGCTTQEESHMCPLLCSEVCPPCTIPVKKRRTICTHCQEVDCNVDADIVDCNNPCRRLLPCGHHCKKKCSEACGDCQVMTDKVVDFCGHTVRVKCCEEPTKVYCQGPCQLKLSCGHPCTKRCMDDCTAICQVPVDYDVLPPCGHNLQVPCHLKKKELEPSNMLKYCHHPCEVLLECGHKCEGTCSECLQGKIHKKCQKKCNTILICGHECTSSCGQICRPCNKPCQYRCIHNKCRNKCSQLCSMCLKSCPRKCEHVDCKALCGEMCMVPPCEQPCPKKIKCGHPCIGFCGDRCPPLCRICNKKELETPFLGFEGEDDARWVLLQECKHVVENRGMVMWLNQKKEEDKMDMKRCPKCNTLLTITPRYKDYFRATMKAKLQLENYDRQQLKSQMRELELQCKEIVLYSKKLNEALFTLGCKLQRKRRRIDVSDLLDVSLKLQLFFKLAAACKEHGLSYVKKPIDLSSIFDFLVKCIIKNEDILTKQQINDIQNEILRFKNAVQLNKIREDESFKQALAENVEVQDLYRKVEDATMNTIPFVRNVDEMVSQLLEQLKNQIKMTAETDLGCAHLKCSHAMEIKGVEAKNSNQVLGEREDNGKVDEAGQSAPSAVAINH